jgi:murein L,D-transpeptidase YafK
MYLIQDGKIIKEYKVSFGANPKWHKEQEGDERTPEGKYILDYKKSDSSFYKAIHVSYPNEEDIAKAKRKKVNPGGQIMIHGQKNGRNWLSFIVQKFNWTNGCIAVTNEEMDEIWNLVGINTPILIEK